MDKEIREDDNCDDMDMARYEIEWIEKQKLLDKQKQIVYPIGVCSAACYIDLSIWALISTLIIIKNYLS